jgi:hypothetical protein
MASLAVSFASSAAAALFLGLLGSMRCVEAKTLALDKQEQFALNRDGKAEKNYLS